MAKCQAAKKINRKWRSVMKINIASIGEINVESIENNVSKKTIVNEIS
jgi:hypothetical protein